MGLSGLWKSLILGGLRVSQGDCSPRFANRFVVSPDEVAGLYAFNA